MQKCRENTTGLMLHCIVLHIFYCSKVWRQFYFQYRLYCYSAGICGF